MCIPSFYSITCSDILPDLEGKQTHLLNSWNEPFQAWKEEATVNVFHGSILFGILPVLHHILNSCRQCLHETLRVVPVQPLPVMPPDPNSGANNDHEALSKAQLLPQKWSHRK